MKWNGRLRYKSSYTSGYLIILKFTQSEMKYANKKRQTRHMEFV
ncbi:hypothetical protein [Peribacillus sp. SI8-4]|nr:hypothetical protein [Peribacillus sp. SI8-4]